MTKPNELKVVPCSHVLLEQVEAKVREVVFTIESEGRCDSAEETARQLGAFAGLLSELSRSVEKHARTWEGPQW